METSKGLPIYDTMVSSTGVNATFLLPHPTLIFSLHRFDSALLLRSSQIIYTDTRRMGRSQRHSMGNHIPCREQQLHTNQREDIYATFSNLCQSQNQTILFQVWDWQNLVHQNQRSNQLLSLSSVLFLLAQSYLQMASRSPPL